MDAGPGGEQDAGTADGGVADVDGGTDAGTTPSPVVVEDFDYASTADLLASTEDYKFIFASIPDGPGGSGNGRFGFNVGNSGDNYDWSGPHDCRYLDPALSLNGYEGVSESCHRAWSGSEAYFDGALWRYRLHVLLPSVARDFGGTVGGDNGTYDGAASIWVEDRTAPGTFTPAVTFSQFGTAATHLYGVVLGANLNKGSDQDMSVYWDYVKVWTEDPGW